MEPNEPPKPPRRKVKFAPKSTARKKPTPSNTPKTEVIDGDHDDDRAKDAEAQLLLRRFNAGRARRGTAGDKKSPPQVAFGPGAPSSSSIRSWGKRSSIEQEDSLDDAEIISTSKATVKSDGDNFDDTSNQKDKDKYIEPWDYRHAYYPTTLPWRRPDSGDPELLDEAEFGEAARTMEYHENSINPASDLGLLEENKDPKMLLFKLPANLPLVKRAASVKGKEVIGKSTSSNANASPNKGCSLEELPRGYMGKLVVYKSGAVKLKLGDILYDVSPGSDCMFAQDFAAINTADKQCCVLGEVGKRAIVTPDIDSLMNSGLDLA